MTDEEFTRKLQDALIALSEIWYEPQWESLNQELLIHEFSHTDLDMAQEAFSYAERLINPMDPQLNIVERIEQWKSEREG